MRNNQEYTVLDVNRILTIDQARVLMAASGVGGVTFDTIDNRISTSHIIEDGVITTVAGTGVINSMVHLIHEVRFMFPFSMFKLTGIPIDSKGRKTIADTGYLQKPLKSLTFSPPIYCNQWIKGSLQIEFVMSVGKLKAESTIVDPFFDPMIKATFLNDEVKNVKPEEGEAKARLKFADGTIRFIKL